jgi:queuine tRNA-ribosyltransferase
MPVGTSGAVKALTAENLEECGAEIILGNTYHLYLRPGPEIIRSQGGLASFNGWHRPTLTDSGGYQVFSMRDNLKISDDGVEFRSHHDGSTHLFTPERVMQIEHDIGADIIMCFDQCVPYPAERDLAATGVRRTYDWAQRCLSEHVRLSEQEEDRLHLFGIVQGSTFADLRTESAEQIVSLDFPGNAIGGLSVGESKDEMEDMLAHTIQYLPREKPRYLMGVGYPEDILMAVSYGVDMFDCVLPTRNARTGNVFTSVGQITYRNADYADDNRPLDPNCDCKVCRRYSRAYIRHLYNQSEITGMVLASYHSTYFFQELMRGIRKSIEEGRFDEFQKAFLARYLGG